MSDGKVCIVVAGAKCSDGRIAIGINNKIPWNSKADMHNFRQLTTSTSMPICENVVIMGTKTWQSIGKRLPNRYNIVISRNKDARRVYNIPNNVGISSSIELAISELKTVSDIETIYVIGGSYIYKDVIDLKIVDKIHMTFVSNQHDPGAFDNCDTFFPLTVNDLESNFIKSKTSYVTKEAHLTCSYHTYKATVIHEEYQYLQLISKVLEHGEYRSDRTGTGTVSLFGETMRFNLSTHFPLLTTKRTYWKGIVEELLWFIRGSTNANELAAKNVKIWDGNGSRDFLDSVGLVDNEEGDLGPVYGFQWRHFGADYKTMHDSYDSQGTDQLQNVIDQIKNNPTSRRIIMSAWNPNALEKMALPPCHLMCQFYVHDGMLSCQMYQRSADIGLGVPFNIASYALLTCLIAHFTNLKPGEFIHVIGDAHVYTNHIDALKTQLKRKPYDFPTIHINNMPKTIFDVTSDDIILNDYKCHPKIHMDMSA
ncbi:thymidylate synthase [Emiliania huxleyi virus 86]|uniref:Thymidylate synthase n=1 Tax=Emiliania huxleyi virus 86 (isolate United Kingdom/English Channel/1999) TaxID=654925 RepID=Q4A320_EHV8U|nr:thymidylate synthase [Emiliania huxleyi virus 86]AHA54694.1 bifunctional dihydrofolate reductase-thymidylate synthase [Emiliania huxleyi virus 145]AHA55723.1 bifunctional dihydrofolate reductase-thymidylate synthase [Emiliania huxleyi virus 164]CAI65536.1 bifunctional dihydrofolate reductase-thymidylate synthase [Emiliania huxleyi virus 86]